MRMKIRLDTMSDIHQFVEAVSHVEEDVILEDGKGMCVSAKSLLGSLYTIEWAEIYCNCQKDISGSILPWIL